MTWRGEPKRVGGSFCRCEGGSARLGLVRKAGREEAQLGVDRLHKGALRRLECAGSAASAHARAASNRRAGLG